jgi:hypothetical protein
VLPVGVFHRLREGYGLQFCPACLDADGEHAYFRLWWRLGFVVACEIHGTLLHDRCPHCTAALSPHRVGLDQPSLAICADCGQSLAAATLSPAEPSVIAFQEHLKRTVERGYANLPSTGPVRSTAYFDVVRHLMRLLSTGKAAGQLCAAASRLSGLKITPPIFPGPNRHIETLGTGDRHCLLAGATAFISDWPRTLIDVCRRERIWTAKLLKDFTEPPHFFLEPVLFDLDRTSYQPTPEEIEAAADWLRRKKGHVPRREAIQFISTTSQERGAVISATAAPDQSCCAIDLSNAVQ